MNVGLGESRCAGARGWCSAVRIAAAGCTLVLVAAAAQAQAQAGPEPIIRRDAAVRVSEHVYVIPDGDVGFVPNVGIVIGERATLIVDTGLGERNGRVVLEEARRLGGGDTFYIGATHFHPEHDLGATAFPATARVVRWQGQQDEADSSGAQTIARFRAISPIVAELLAGAEFRAPDVLFDDAVTLDLGGVRVRLTGVGPNHTLGDTVFWVEQDRVLFTGDVVMSVFPAVNGQAGDLALWLANLDAFEALAPVTIVPAHGRIGDLELVRDYRAYLGAVRDRVAALAREGVTLEAARDRLVPELAAEFARLSPVRGTPDGRIGAAIQAAYRGVSR